MLAWYKQVCACIQKFGICCSYVYTQVYLLFQPEMTILHLKVSFVLCKTDMLIESTAFSIIMRFFFLHDVHEVIAYKICHACLSVHLVQLKNCGMSFD
jgi:hypothetical protein